MAGLSRRQGWSFDQASGLRVRPRRALVQHKIIKAGPTTNATYQHLRYLEREGVHRDGEPGRLFSTFTNEADREAFLARSGRDPHQFRLILSPEDGAAYEDLKPFTRDVVARLEVDLDTILDWVAADHYDSGRPHVHVVIRGVTETGRALNIAGDYLRFGIAHRAAEVVTRDLGLKIELEPQLGRDVDAERFTELDRRLIDRAKDGIVDLRVNNIETDLDRLHHQALVSRMRLLERMRLATQDKPLQWQLSPNLADVLEDMGERAAQRNAVHRAIIDTKLSRPPQFYMFHDRLEHPLTGAIIASGRAADKTERGYIVLDGVDGRTHYLDIGTLGEKPSVGSIVRVSPYRAGPRRADKTIGEIASANGGRYDLETHLRSDRTATPSAAEAHIRRVEAIARTTGLIGRDAEGSWKIGPDYMNCVRAYENSLVQARPVVIETLSALPLAHQISADGATWLDRQLVGAVSQEHAHHGFGSEVDEALRRRQQWLIEQDLAQRDGDQIVYRGNLLDGLTAREVQREVRRLEGELHKPFARMSRYEQVEGTFRQSLELSSGRFALIEKSYEFTLVPWKPELERYVGRVVSGIPAGDAFEWSLGRSRGISR